MKKVISVLLTVVLLMGCLFTGTTFSASAATSEFYFNGTMSKEVLRNYVSRSVTHQCLVANTHIVDAIFEEDLRMLRRIGAKYIGRAATFSWNAYTTNTVLEKHFTICEQQAEKVHAADSEIILQAAIHEIIFKESVESYPIPAYVFEAFDQTVVTRNFDFESIAFPAGTTDKNGTDNGIGCWGTARVSGVPDITQLETKMYFYYLITRYIDAGFEAVHMGQAEKMMLYRGNSYAYHWDELLTKAREYAATNARRGIILFDYHNAIDSGGIMVGDRLIFDIQGAALVPSETVFEDNAMKCEVTAPSGSHWLSWVGRSAGGTHPLGFTVENNFTILEFDNYGYSGNPGVATYESFMNWGFDDITWFALQPEEYRNQFLKETDAYLKSHCLDSSGNQQYFLQPACKRNVTTNGNYVPKTLYVPGEKFNSSYLDYYTEEEGTEYVYNSVKNGYVFSVDMEYRANTNSDACPNGFNQEDTIREIFLGEGAEEDPELLEVNLPDGYEAEETYTKEFTVHKKASSVTSSTDRALADIAKVLQGYEVDIWAAYRQPGEAYDYAHWELDYGQYMVLELLVDANASTLKLANLDFDSSQGFKFEISADNKNFYTMVDYGGEVDNENLESIIEPQYFTNRGASAYALSEADLRDGKKVVYLKISTYSGTGMIKIKSFDVTTTKNVSAEFVTNAAQSYIAKTDCRSDYSPNPSSPNYFDNYVVNSMSNHAFLYWTVKLDAVYPKIVFKFDLEDNATNFSPYLYVPDASTGNIKIEASKDGSTWYEIVSSVTVEPYSTYGDLGENKWTNLNQTNINKVLSSNSTKTVYLRYSFVGTSDDGEIHLQHFGISAEYSVDLASNELGDSNGDSALDILDLISFKKAVLFDKGYVSYRDLNSDNAINSLDLIVFKKYLFGTITSL